MSERDIDTNLCKKRRTCNVFGKNPPSNQSLIFFDLNGPKIFSS